MTVKWQGKKFDVPIDTSEPGSTFKFQIYSLTGVPPERQKVVIKGTQLKDDQNMSELPLKSGMSVLMIGMSDATGIIKRPETKTVFLEDMSVAEKAMSVWIRFREIVDLDD